MAMTIGVNAVCSSVNRSFNSCRFLTFFPIKCKIPSIASTVAIGKSLDSILQNKVSARWSGNEFIKIFGNMRRALYEDSPVMQPVAKPDVLLVLLSMAYKISNNELFAHNLI